MDNQNQFNSIDKLTDLSKYSGYIDDLTISDSGKYAAAEIKSGLNFNTDILIYNRQNNTAKSILNLLVEEKNSNSYYGLYNPVISGNGNYIAFTSFGNSLIPNDNNSAGDAFVFNRINQTVERISVANDGSEANGEYSYAESISDDGRYITFSSDASNLAGEDTNQYLSDVFARDRLNQTTELITPSAAGFEYYDSTISDDGRYVAYEANFVSNGDQEEEIGNISIYDRIDRTTEIVDISTDGVKANDGSVLPTISGDGRYVVFESEADNLVLNDNNGKRDIFVRNLIDRTTEIVSASANETNANGQSYDADISDDGRYVSFRSNSDNLVPNDNNDSEDRFVYDRLMDTMEMANLAADGTQFEDGGEETALSGNGQHLLFTVGEDNPEVYVRSQELSPVNDFNTSIVHRFFDYSNGFHLYTADDNEIDYLRQESLVGNTSYQYESRKFSVLANDRDALTGETIKGVEPVYRFFNRETGSHLYTMDENEKTHIQNTLDNYSFEGIKYYAFESEVENIDSIPVFRMLNGISGSHLFTIDENEIRSIQENLPHFSMENNGDPAFYVFDLPPVLI